MTQQQVLEYVLSKECYLYEQNIKEDGIYFYVRRNGTKKMVVIYPLIKGDGYTMPAVCHICQTLHIAAPQDIEPYCKAVSDAKEKVKVLEQFPATSTN